MFLFVHLPCSPLYVKYLKLYLLYKCCPLWLLTELLEIKDLLQDPLDNEMIPKGHGDTPPHQNSLNAVLLMDRKLEQETS